MKPLTKKQLFKLLQGGSETPALIPQEGTVVARMNQRVDGKSLTSLGFPPRSREGENINYDALPFLGAYERGYSKVTETPKVAQTFRVPGKAEKKAYLVGDTYVYPMVSLYPELSHLDQRLGVEDHGRGAKKEQKFRYENSVRHREFIEGCQVDPEGQPLYTPPPTVDAKAAGVLSQSSIRYRLEPSETPAKQVKAA